MAKAGTVNPATLLGDATRSVDLRHRLLFLLGALVVYRVGSFIPVPGIDPEQLLRTAAAVTLRLGDGGERVLHGLISRFTQLGRSEELAAYQAEIVPWLWFLSLSTDCRVFQNLSTLEIVEEVFGGLGYSDFEIKCTKSYAKREYCVQYRETHLNFVSRLLEEEGIYYFFQHSDDKHVLVLADGAPRAARRRAAASHAP